MPADGHDPVAPFQAVLEKGAQGQQFSHPRLPPGLIHGQGNSGRPARMSLSESARDSLSSDFVLWNLLKLFSRGPRYRLKVGGPPGMVGPESDRVEEPAVIRNAAVSVLQQGLQPHQLETLQLVGPQAKPGPQTAG